MMLIWKLLRKHISLFELAVFFIANLIGLVVILAGIQIYSDAKSLINGDKESLIGNDYIAISKVVEGIGINSQKCFSQEEIDELLQQENILSVGNFTASNFEVRARLAIGSEQMSTDMFFEAVPDEFIDVNLDEWHVDTELVGNTGPNMPIIPIIIPRNYLNLYNFGFSAAQGLPQITDSILTKLEMDITIKGYVLNEVGVANYKQDKYIGYIVGFTDRINTILVPQQFISWANDHYGNNPNEIGASNNIGPSRIIMEVDNPSDPKLNAFLSEHGYITEGKPSESGKALVILQRSVTIVVAIGALFCLLSVIILTLSIFLLLQKNMNKLENLVLIGHTPIMVSMPYILMTVVLNVSILLVGIGIVAYGRSHFLEPIFKDFLGAGLSTSMSPTIIAGLVLTLVIISFNIFIILYKVKQISRKR